MKRILIMGAAGRDFHTFNTMYRDNKDVEVVGFTATQIPGIENRKYPPELAGSRYPEGIPIEPESRLSELVTEKVDEVVFAYSDVTYDYVIQKGEQVKAAGASFVMFDIDKTMLPSKKPVVAICAVRTGCGKSQTTRMVASILKEEGKKVAVVRHPMPYGDLVKQEVQRFSTLEDLDKHDCTIEEREEYEPHIREGSIVYAGVDYEKILRQAENEADVILWDGGNNDTPFYKPDLHIVVFDPLRPGHELTYFPGKVNAEMADLALINKVNTAKEADIKTVEKNITQLNPRAEIIRAASLVKIDNASIIKNKRVLVIEDGPTLTHGEMKFGAGIVAARQADATLVDPRSYAVGSIKGTFKKYPEIGTLLPAMGYGEGQMRDLQETINSTPCDAVVIATPIDLTKLIKIDMPTARVNYALDPEVKHLLKRAIIKAIR